jgi:glycosyltransferase involved in cell wall biosynthesis
MKICIVVPELPTASATHQGGVGTYAILLARVLVDAGNEVHVVVYSERPQGDATPQVNVQVHRVRVTWVPYLSLLLPNLIQAWQLCRAVRLLDKRERFDVIEGANDEGMMFFVAGAFGRRFWMRLHSSLRQHIENKREPLTPRRKFLVWLDGAAARRSRNLVTHSWANRSEVAAEYGVAPERIAIVPHATEAPPQESHSDFSSGRATVAYIGTQDQRKGIDLLLRAIPGVAREFPSAEFLIIGRDGGDSGSESWRQWFLDRFPGIAGTGRVRFLGSVSKEALDELWRRIDVIVVPSRYESFGLVVIEAFARGKPVVVTDGGALPEVASGAARIASRTPEAIAMEISALLGDPRRAREMGMLGFKTFREKYTLAAMQTNVLKLYGAAGR